MNIEMRGINKSFGSNQVLKDAGFVLKDGEVHALMGENGAGKSTLMKILTGVYTKDSGTIIVDGKEVSYKNPQEAEKAGIVFIYQELNVLFDLTVEENLFMGKEITKGFGICDKKAMRAKAQEVMDRMGVHIPIDAVMSDLSVGQQQMVEICKALMVDAKVLIMDEPTAALTESETKVLFEVMRSLSEKGVSIVYISHRMEEIFEMCERITILRDGQYVDTRYIKDINMSFLGLDLTATPSIKVFNALLLIPVISVVLMLGQQFITQKLNGQQSNSSTTAMMLMTTLMFGYFSFMMPAGVSIYWIFSSFFAILQELILRLFIDPEKEKLKIEEEIYEARKARKEKEKQRPAKVAKAKEKAKDKYVEETYESEEEAEKVKQRLAKARALDKAKYGD